MKFTNKKLVESYIELAICVFALVMILQTSSLITIEDETVELAEAGEIQQTDDSVRLVYMPNSTYQTVSAESSTESYQQTESLSLQS